MDEKIRICGKDSIPYFGVFKGFENYKSPLKRMSL